MSAALDSVPRDESDTRDPNPVYLLLRNIVLLEGISSIEDQVRIRTGCLNQALFVPQTAQASEDFHADFLSKSTANMCDYLIPVLAEELISNIHDDEQERVINLVCLIHLKRLPLDGLPLLIDHMIEIPNPSPLVYRLLCASWIRSHTRNPHIHKIMEALWAVQMKNPDVSPLWRFEAAEDEITTALARVNAQKRRFLEVMIQQEQKQQEYSQILGTFDDIIAQGCGGGQRAIIAGLMCNDLRKFDLSLHGDHFPYIRQSVAELRDPWLRLCGYLAAGMYRELEESSMVYIDIPGTVKEFLTYHLLEVHSSNGVIKRLRMRFWRQMDADKTTRLIKQALENTDTLSMVGTSCYKSSIHPRYPKRSTPSLLWIHIRLLSLFPLFLHMIMRIFLR
ncbi:hypothetical protein CPB86DRAFT_498343 [Serendipita vermifera]|nr:hypothetical protein CPB86DRAFT_498343 [Serendipita vermifera]